MKNIFLTFLKIIVPVGFGVLLVWWVFKQLSPEEKTHLYKAFEIANYSWILLSVCFGILSHMSRAYRWKYLLEPLGMKPKFWNSFFSVMIGYGANLLLPRLGEMTRCGVMSKYSKMPFDKLFGTVIAERVADMSILITLIVTVVFMQLPVLRGTLDSMVKEGRLSEHFTLALMVSLFILMAALLLGFGLLKKSNGKIANKIKNLIRGFKDGLLSILRMKNSGFFILHTLMIWILYLIMFYICFFSLPGTSSTPLPAVLAAFVIGGLSIVLVQGGIGVYPASVMATLALYGIASGTGLALGWIIWAGQTLMIIGLAVISLILMPKYNKLIYSGQTHQHRT